MTNPYDTGRFAKVRGLEQVTSHTDVARIVDQMLEDLRQNPTEWENSTLERFLDALSACLDGVVTRYANRGQSVPDQPNWKLVTEALVVATGYE